MPDDTSPMPRLECVYATMRHNPGWQRGCSRTAVNEIELTRSPRAKDGIALAVFLVLLTIVSVWFFMQRYWWLTPLASAHGGTIDRMFYITLVISGALFVLLQMFLALVVMRFRNRGADTARTAIRRRIENRFALVAGILIFGVDVTLYAMGESRWFNVWGPVPENAAVVEVTGAQFMWHFHYAGHDGVFGRTDRGLVASDNPIGLDAKDPASTDDIVSNELHLAVNRPVRVQLRSRDVIHSFYLPNFRVKQDALPGMQIEVWFVPNVEGRFEIACNQLCGMFHYRMRGFVTVESQQKVDEWLAQDAQH
jgi:cytochrome c oxidase subunit 2